MTEIVEQKAFYKSRTFWVGLGIVLLPVVDSYIKDIGVDDPRIIGLIGILTTILRFFTTMGVGVRDDIKVKYHTSYHE